MNTGSSIKVLIFLGIIALALFILGKFYSKFKVPKVGALTLVNGGLKTGKSTFAFYLAYKNYQRALLVWKIRTYFQKLLRRKQDEMPLFYSNIPVNVPYVKLTNDLILMKKRFRQRSVCFIDEASLLADSQLYKDDKINERLLMFCKLYGHCTKGALVFNTQAISDLHYAFKRCVSEYYYIHHLEKRIPFFLIAKVREERYSDDGSIINAYTEDVEDSLKKVLVPKRTWKKFDAYAFSFLTDDLECEDKVIYVNNKDLKARELLSFRVFVNEQFRRYQNNVSDNRRQESKPSRTEVCNKVCVQVEEAVSEQGRSETGNDTTNKTTEGL